MPFNEHGRSDKDGRQARIGQRWTESGQPHRLHL